MPVGSPPSISSYGSSSAISELSYSSRISRMISSVLTEKSQLAVRMPTGSRPAMRRQRLGGAERQVAFGLARQRGVGLVDPGMDADLVPVVGDAAHLLGMQQRRHGGIEEARRDRFAFQQRADARHRLAVAVLALADAHRAFVAVAQRDGFVVGVEADRHRAARAVRPGLRLQAAAGAGAADDAAPGGFRPLPGLLFDWT